MIVYGTESALHRVLKEIIVFIVHYLGVESD